MINQRRLFDASYKVEVVRMIVDQGLSVSQVSKNLTISESAIRSGEYLESREIKLWIEREHAISQRSVIITSAPTAPSLIVAFNSFNKVNAIVNLVPV